jgi:hypothetical protein
MSRPRFRRLGLDPPWRRDAGLIGLSILAAGAVYLVTPESGAVARGATAAVATANGKYGRQAKGRGRAAVQIIAGAARI